MMSIAILTCNNTITQIKSRVYPLIPEPIKELVSIHQFDINKGSTSESIRLRFKVLVQTNTLKYIIVTDSKVFKAITGQTKAKVFYSELVMSTIEKSVYIIYIPPASQMYYNPEGVTEIIKRGFTNIENHHMGITSNTFNMKTELYGITDTEVADLLTMLLDKQCDLTCDIEAFSLSHYSAGIGTISFAWNKEEGVALSIANLFNDPTSVTKIKLLKSFFNNFKHRLIFHNSGYDITVLIYTLYMAHLEDTEGLLEGLNVFSKISQDTLLITYLAMNSTARNSLGLKDLAQEFAGNYALEDIKDITKIPLPKLLKYNLIDAMSTWYVLEKYYPKLISDGQKEVYENIFRPAMFEVIQMQLTGMPVIPNRILEVKSTLQSLSDVATENIINNPLVIDFIQLLKEEWVVTRNNTLKVKRVTLEDATDVSFNLNSGKQLTKFLYTVLELPVINTTESKQPSTDNETLRALSKHTEDKAIQDFLNNLVDYKDVDKMLTTFIPLLERHVTGKSGQAYIFGSLRLGGTISGRLSSTGGLQQLPANSRFSKLIKSCFGTSVSDWIMTGLDFSSLEAKIGALLTRDPAKMDVYLYGYDSHCFNTYIYFKDKLPYITDKLNKIDPKREYYKVTKDDGSVDYVTDLDLPK